MASLAQLITWWCTNKVPTIQQRIATLGSYRHKDDAIALADVGGLAEALNAKAPIAGIAIEAQARANSDISIRSALADESQARGAQDAYLYELIQALKTLDIPPYDNDTAALAGGLAIGDLYHKPDGSVWVLKPLDYSAGYSYDGLPVPGIGSEHLYLSLDSLDAEIAALRSVVSASQPFSNKFHTSVGGSTYLLFRLPAFTLLSTMIIMPLTNPLFGVQVVAQNGVPQILFSGDIPIGGGADNPFLLNFISSIDQDIYIYTTSGKTDVFIKAIIQ
jgi:hypothetical protein